MFILSFRDMSVAQCGGVTSAAVYELDEIDAKYLWSPASPLSLRLASWDRVSAAFRRKNVLFVIHGFNVNRDNGYTGLGAFAQELSGLGALSSIQPPEVPLNLKATGVDLIVPVLWPGDWYLPINYPFVLPDARATGRNMADFILSSATRMASASFFTHSFGVRVALEAIQAAVTAKAGYAAPIFDTAILAAAATSDIVLDNPSYKEAVSALRRIVVVSAATDQVLSGAFVLGNAVEEALWANDGGPDTALGHAGPRLAADSIARPKTTWYDTSVLDPPIDQQHGDYLPAPGEQPRDILPNGWNSKRERIGSLVQSILAHRQGAWLPSQPIPEP